VQADYILDYNVISVAQEHHVYLLARIKAGQAVDLVERLPLNLSVVLDRSGSMAGDKLDYVK
jgi:Ca-activated chloride channel family protein